MRAIFFDLDGTLLHFTRDYRVVLADAFEAVAGGVRDEWLDTYDDAFFEYFEACEPDPVRRAFERVDATEDPHALVAALREHEVAMCEPPEGVHDDLERLAETHALGVLTNGLPTWQHHKLHAHGLDRYLDAVVTSYEAGAHKPDTAPYRLAEQRLPACDYAMVGDADADIDGAKRADWAAYRYGGDGFGTLPDGIEWDR